VQQKFVLLAQKQAESNLTWELGRLARFVTVILPLFFVFQGFFPDFKGFCPDFQQIKTFACPAPLDI